MRLNQHDLRILYDHALSYGLRLSQQQLHLFQIYLRELWDWNKRINLTGISTRDGMILELFLDSLIPAPFLPVEGRMLDVGSGAGFPGIPLKIYHPRLQTVLLEPNSKKVSFLKQVIRALTLEDIEVIKGRFEKRGPNLQSEGRDLSQTKYHLITARALAGMDQIIKWCAPFLLPGGVLITFLGSHIKSALNESEKVREKHSLILCKTIPYRLPGKQSERNTLIFKRET